MRILDCLRPPSVALDVGTAMTRGCSDVCEVIEHPSSTIDELSSPGGRGALRGGVVCDVAAAAEVIAPVLRAVARKWRRPVVLVCAPTDATEQERDLLVEAVVSAGASVSAVVPEPLAAAIVGHHRGPRDPPQRHPASGRVRVFTTKRSASPLHHRHNQLRRVLQRVMEGVVCDHA